jgi:hypothetical protein
MYHSNIVKCMSLKCISFLLAYINSTRHFIVIIPLMCTVYFEQVHSLYYNPTLSSTFQTVFGGFQYAIFMCVCVTYFDPLHSQVCSPFPPPPSADTPFYTDILSSFHHHWHHYHFRSRDPI